MHQRSNVYRRPNGIYVVRLTVPKACVLPTGQREIHLSSQTSCRRDALQFANRVRTEWLALVIALQWENTVNFSEDSSLSRTGLVSVQELSDSKGVSQKLILSGIVNNNIPIAIAANSIPGYLVNDFTDLEREPSGGFVLDSAFAAGNEHHHTGYMSPFHPRNTVFSILESGYAEETVFRLFGRQRKKMAFFVDLPGIKVDGSSVLIMQLHADKLTGLSTEIKTQNRSLSHTPTSQTGEPKQEIGSDFINPRFWQRKSSWLVESFLAAKDSNWSAEQRTKMHGMCNTFVDLMGDPKLSDVDRELIRDYETQLRRMPANRYNAARRHGTNNPIELQNLAETNREPLLSSTSVFTYISKLSEMFKWAKRERIFLENPADKISSKPKANTRQQDQRQKFSHEELLAIFSAPWFKIGAEEKNKHNRFHQFRPFYYWMPLLALFTGGRRNELAQLYLSDFRETATGTPYISFNLDESDKKDIDGNDSEIPEKSLKTINAIRDIPIHPILIELGLLEYVKALSESGYRRLFPELRKDPIKGYGKPVGSWFNERFLGQKLNIPRDGTRSFHSFRHTFITALLDTGMPPRTRAQIAGHERGDTITDTRYTKDSSIESVLPFVKMVEFSLPKIARFQSNLGVSAVTDALRWKERLK